MKRRSYQNWLILVLSLALVAQVWTHSSYSSVRAQKAVATPCTGELSAPQQMHEMSSQQSATLFARQLAESMDKMHEEMRHTPMNGEADHDFLAMMIPHHQGAIDMAKLILLHGKDERVRRLAQGIIIEQQSEIDMMRRLIAGSRTRMTEER